jgi:hypothetical protein
MCRLLKRLNVPAVPVIRIKGNAMPTPETIASEKQQLYESASLRDDLNDTEATVLLKWGETQVERLAQLFPDEFEQKTRFLRQLLKNINRFVGQREFNDMDGQSKYMESVVKFLEPLGYKGTQEEIFAALPTDAKDMKANLDAILNLLTPQTASPTDTPPPPSTPEDLAITQPEQPAATTETSASEPSQPEDIAQVKPAPFRPNIDKTEVIPDISHLIKADDDKEAVEKKPAFRPNIDKTEVIPDISHLVREAREVIETLATDPNAENSDADTVDQPDNTDTTGDIDPNDEKAE